MTDEPPEEEPQEAVIYYLNHLEQVSTEEAIKRLRDFDELLYQMLADLKSENRTLWVNLHQAQAWGTIVWDQKNWTQAQLKERENWVRRCLLLQEYDSWKRAEEYRRWAEWHPTRTRLIHRILKGGGWKK